MANAIQKNAVCKPGWALYLWITLLKRQKIIDQVNDLYMETTVDLNQSPPCDTSKQQLAASKLIALRSMDFQ